VEDGVYHFLRFYAKRSKEKSEEIFGDCSFGHAGGSVLVGLSKEEEWNTAILDELG